MDEEKERRPVASKLELFGLMSVVNAEKETMAELNRKIAKMERDIKFHDFFLAASSMKVVVSGGVEYQLEGTLLDEVQSIILNWLNAEVRETKKQIDLIYSQERLKRR